MKAKDLRNIYDFNEQEEKFVINVQLEDYRDAYSDWDFSPFINRDLDDDLTEYLLECSYEIPLKYDMMIKFNILNQEYNQLREERSITGMHNYFKYQIRKLRNKQLRVLQNIIRFAMTGIVLLFASTYLRGVMQGTMLSEILVEGLIIGGWVMVWEMFTAWFFDMREIRSQKNHFTRLDESKISYAYDKQF